MKSQTIRILFNEDRQNRWWSAQCLEYDIAAQGRTFADVMYEIQRVLTGHVVVSEELGIEPFTGIKAAPAVFWQIFDHAKIHVKREPIPFSPSHVPIHSDSRIAEMCPTSA